MVVTNDIIYSFINCPYKAYLKSRQQSGFTSDYETLYNKLKQTQISNFKKKLSENGKTLFTDISYTNPFQKKCSAFNVKFLNENIDIVLDGIEFLEEKAIIPVFITPFEKVTTLDKLFMALQVTFIQTKFSLPVEGCKIISGHNLKETKFRISSFSKAVKKISNDLAKSLLNSNAPTFFKNAHCQVCEFKNNCLEKLIDRDDLSLLAGLKPKEILQKNNRGIFSTKQLSYLFRPKKNPNRKRIFSPELKALAIRESKTLIQEMPSLKEDEAEIFLDFEGIPDRNSNYLVGVIIRTNNAEKEYSFWANSKEEENSIFIQLIDLLKPLKSFIIYHYGSYEIRALKNISKNLSIEYQYWLKVLIDNAFNLLNIFTHNLYPPTYSNSLKEIARFLEFAWTDREATGLQSIIWRYNWELTQNEYFKNKLITYNLEDCKALIKVKDWVRNIPKSDDESFENAEKLKRQSIYKWGSEKFIVNELVQINSFAYFNYQREKILVKNYPQIARRQKVIDAQKTNKNLKPNKIVEILRPKVCPECKGLIFYKHDKHTRTVIDLKISKSGIKKVITLYYASRYKCRNCGKNINLKNLIGQSKYGRNFSCWIINQIIHYRMSYVKISEQVKEIFDVDLITANIVRIKSKYAKYYKSTFNEIIEVVRSSSIIHIDETIFHIKNETCYIWVFTNIDTVFYLFKHSRESDFLKELLVNYKGVLIMRIKS